MATNFPGVLDSTSNLIDSANDATVTAISHAAAHNAAADAIIAIETVIGVNPSGSYATIKAALADMVVKTPSLIQVITPSADVVALVVKAGSNLFVSHLFEGRLNNNTIVAYLDAQGNFSAQGFKVNGAALASTHLADGNVFSKKDQVAAFGRAQGVSGGLTSDPRTALQVAASNSFTLTFTAGSALIQGTDDPTQPMYAITSASGTIVLGTHAPGTFPRIDAICVRYNDSRYTGRSPGDTFELIQVTGTPTSGATLTNLNGKPATPASSLLLAYILVLTTDTGVQTANVLDQRKIEGPAVWGEDGRRYRLGVDGNGTLGLEQVV